mgnify:CR=1 FL=1
METIIIFAVGFVVGVFVGRKNPRAVESIISFAKNPFGKK